jgi:hypothetical protein
VFKLFFLVNFGLSPLIPLSQERGGLLLLDFKPLPHWGRGWGEAIFTRIYKIAPFLL